jgi:hypothetical protein
MSSILNRWWRPAALLIAYLIFARFGGAPGGVGYLMFGMMGLVTGLVAADYAHKGYRVRSWLGLLVALTWMVWVSALLLLTSMMDEPLVRAVMMVRNTCYGLSFLTLPMILWAAIDAVRGIPRVAQEAEAV